MMKKFIVIFLLCTICLFSKDYKFKKIKELRSFQILSTINGCIHEITENNSDLYKITIDGKNEYGFQITEYGSSMMFIVTNYKSYKRIFSDINYIDTWRLIVKNGYDITYVYYKVYVINQDGKITLNIIDFNQNMLISFRIDVIDLYD